jgi:putative membrane protein
MWWNDGFGWFFPGLWCIPFFVIFWLFVAFVVWGGWRWRGYDHRHHHWAGEKSAEDILADRFARGEIDENEYNKRLEVLQRR